MKRIVCYLVSLCLMAGCLCGCIQVRIGTPAENSRAEITPSPEPSPTPEPERFETVYIDAPIKWKDETFKKLIYDELGKDYSEEICPQDLSFIRELFILGDDVILINQSPMWNMMPDSPGQYTYKGTVYSQPVSMCLDDLANFLNIEALKICLVETEDIEFLPEIPMLKYLHMSGCGITDISCLSRCGYLRELYMADNSITDISVVKNMTLWDLSLPYNNLSDISPVAGMARLPEEIILSYNNISDISALASNGRNSGLAYLNLRDNNITDISPLAGFTNISILSLTNNSITDVSPLKNLSKQNDIYLVGNPVENMEELKGFYNVRK